MWDLAALLELGVLPAHSGGASMWGPGFPGGPENPLRCQQQWVQGLSSDALEGGHLASTSLRVGSSRHTGASAERTGAALSWVARWL